MAQIKLFGITLAVDTTQAREELRQKSIEREARALINAEIRAEEVKAAKIRMAAEADKRAAEVQALVAALKSEQAK